MGERRTEEYVECGEYFGSWTFDGVRSFPGSGLGVAVCASLHLLTAHNAREALACVDVEQMNCIRGMVVVVDEERGNIYAAITKWQRHLEFLTKIW